MKGPVMNGNPKPLLVLDLDETLVHTLEKPLSRPADLQVCGFHVYLRPHLREFLVAMQEVFDLAVWSAGSSDYVEPTVEKLFAGLNAPLFVWSSRRCTRRFDHEVHDVYYIKDLRKVKKKGFDLRRVLIVEDLERNCERNFGNAVYVRAFEGCSEDSELKSLAAYLKTLASQPNFRTVEKRYWRSSNKLGQ